MLRDPFMRARRALTSFRRQTPILHIFCSKYSTAAAPNKNSTIRNSGRAGIGIATLLCCHRPGERALLFANGSSAADFFTVFN